MRKIKLTPTEWQQILGITILDPDGWNRQANQFQADWARPLTFDEFIDKANQSTVGPGSLNFGREELYLRAISSI